VQSRDLFHRPGNYFYFRRVETLASNKNDLFDLQGIKPLCNMSKQKMGVKPLS
jgi:hypothetical protein